MIILIYGKEPYRVYEKTKEIINQHKGKGSIVFLNKEIEAIEKEVGQNSIFKEKKLIVLQDLWSSIEGDKKTLSLIESLTNSDEITILVKEEKVSKKTESFFNKKGKVFALNPLTGSSLNNWIRERIEKGGGAIEEDALLVLINSVGDDLWMASNEIDKLLAYKKGIIKKEDVVFLTRPRIEGDIFKAINFLASRNRKAAFDIFYRHIKRGDHILYLITMITFQFRNLLLVKLNPKSNSQDLGMHPFVFQKSTRQAHFFSEAELKSIYKKILKAEIDIKTGKTDIESAFDFLVMSIK